MFKIKTISRGEYLAQFGLYTKISCNVSIDYRATEKENLLDFNNYVGFTKEDPSRNLEESFYFMIEENHKKNRSSIIDYKPNKMRQLFDKSYRETSKLIKENAYFINESFENKEDLQKYFDDNYSHLKDIDNNTVRVIDHDLNIGKEIYAISLNGSLRFSDLDDGSQSSIITLKKYKITHVSLREQSHSDTDFYEIFEVHSESEDGAYTTASFTIKKEKDNGEYRLSSGYSDLRFYQNLEEAKSAIKDIKTRFISTLIS
ncbi:MAG: hypothetical protein CL760_11655 [Chloroflexi bacterium]|nr:hypothetical protein [Chloroflexota bacterium]|tara:strand:+ start:91647 stop:92423 length:777 start_codon:yes stop_codon:yes gene_type:complete